MSAGGRRRFRRAEGSDFGGREEAISAREGVISATGGGGREAALMP